jgi:hypothetical protein
LFGTSWRAGRIAGIEIRVDSSWVVIALLITYSMYLRFSFLFKDLSTGAAVGIAIQVRQLPRGAQAQDVTASDLVRPSSTPRARPAAG